MLKYDPKEPLEWNDNITFEYIRENLINNIKNIKIDNIKINENNNIKDICFLLIKQLGKISDGIYLINQNKQNKRYFNNFCKSLINISIILILLSHHCGIDLGRSILHKIELNAKKYPIELSKGRYDKYVAYQSVTSFSRDTKVQKLDENKENEDNENLNLKIGLNSIWNENITLENIRYKAWEFVDDRNWHGAHKQRNIILALTGEVGELCELFQWATEIECKSGLITWTKEEKILPLAQELADCWIYLTRLCDISNFNLALGIENKLNELKSNKLISKKLITTPTNWVIRFLGFDDNENEELSINKIRSRFITSFGMGAGLSIGVGIGLFFALTSIYWAEKAQLFGIKRLFSFKDSKNKRK